jgi:hypothetical protein
MTPQAALQRVIEHREIFHDEMVSLMRQIMGGEVSPVMIAAIITGLRVKKETIGEIAAAASVMRELSTPVKLPYDKPFRRHRRHRRRCGAYLQYLDRPRSSSRRGRRQGGQARRAQRVVQFRQCRRARGARRQHHAVAGRSPPASRSAASASCSRPITTAP